MRLDKAKDCSIQKYLEISSKYCILVRLVQFETRSRERIAGRMRSSSTTHYELFAPRKWYA